MSPIHRSAAAVLVLAAAAAAQEDPKAEAQARVELARPQVARGAYFDAIGNLRKALAADPASVDAALLLARAYGDTGEYRKAADVLAPFDGSAPALVRRAELLLGVGDEAGAQAAADAAASLDPLALGALVVTGRIQEATGRRDEAVATYEEVNRRWVKTDDAQETDDVLLAVARARLGVYRLSTEHAQDLEAVLSKFEPIVKRDKDRVDAMVELGELYLSHYQDQSAVQWFTKAAERNPHYAPALFGKARQLAFRYEEVEAARVCEEQVLRENPAFVPALVFLAVQALGDGDLARADGLVARALVVNPVDPEVRAAKAASSYLAGDAAAFESEVKAILARNRFASPAYAVLAHVLEEQRRFAEAFAFAEKAVAVDPLDWDSYFLAGRNALNVGEDEKGRKYLEAAEKGDLFHNTYRANFLKLFRRIENFPVRKDERFVVRLPPEEEEPYFRLLRSRMDWSLDRLEQRWGVRSELPLYVSVFDQQNDFATRTIGLPGFPALGACFGRVMTLDSPRALPPGAFAWTATLHHELAHVITLQLSKGRVPRWLTEGASVYEERKVSPVWNREMERELIDAIWSDEVLTLKDINNAFRGPRVLFAYYQGGLMCELIERDFGFPKLKELVRLHGEGLPTDACTRSALGVEPEEFDRRFLAYAKDHVKDLLVLRRPSEAKLARLKRELRRKPDDGEAWLLLAEGSIARGDAPSALSALANAAKALPGDGRVAMVRALIAWRERRAEQAAKHAEEAIAKGADLYELRMGLAAHYAGEGKDAARAEAHYEMAIALFPLEKGKGDPRLALARILTAEGEQNLPEVMRLLREHVDVDEDDVATRRQLATMYAQQGRPDDELLMLEQVREIAPLPNRDWSRDDAVALHERLGEAYVERKRYADAELAFACAVGVARMDLGKASAPAPSDVVAELLAAQAESLQLLGRAEDAGARVEESLRLDPDNERARRLREALGH